VNTFVRWWKFNLVGAMGMVVQLAALEAISRSAPGHYLVASAAAVELALLHNFVWHLHYTWRDRRDDSAVLSQLVRFHLSNGLVSIVGNLVLMRILVHETRLPLLVANSIAILSCSVVNFCLGHTWAFAMRPQMATDGSIQAGLGRVGGVTVAESGVRSRDLCGVGGRELRRRGCGLRAEADRRR